MERESKQTKYNYDLWAVEMMSETQHDDEGEQGPLGVAVRTIPPCVGHSFSQQDRLASSVNLHKNIFCSTVIPICCNNLKQGFL